MRKIYSFSAIVILSLLFANCKSDEKPQDFKSITDNYFNEKNELSPLEATFNGQTEQNDKLVFEMTDAYRSKKKAFFEKYLSELKK